MKIRIEETYDSFCVFVDDKRFYIHQGESVELLVDAFTAANPEADVEYEEVY